MKQYFVSWMEEFNATVWAEDEAEAIEASKHTARMSLPEQRYLYDVEELEVSNELERV